MRFVYPDAVIERIPVHLCRWFWSVDLPDGSSVAGWTATFLGAHRAADKARREAAQETRTAPSVVPMAAQTVEMGTDSPQTGYGRCGWPWTTSSNVDIAKHECELPTRHGMEHRCRCGELYPS